MLQLLRKGTLAGVSQVCKIHYAAGIVFAFTGIYSAEPPPEMSRLGKAPSFSILAQLQAALGVPGTLADKLPVAGSAASEALLGILGVVRREQPDEFKKLIGQSVLEILFATVEKGVPILASRAYRPSLGSDGKIELTQSIGSCPGTCPFVNGMLTVGLGVHGEINKYLGINEIHAIPGPSWPDWLAQLVQFEVEAEPNAVGPPISVVELDATGAHWSKGRNGACVSDLK